MQKGPTRRTQRAARFLVAALALALALALAGPTGPSLAEPPGISFADDSDLAPSGPELAKGVAVTVCNSTAVPIVVATRFEGFDFPAASALVTPRDQPLGPGQCGDVVVKTMPSPPALTEASYEGDIVLVTNGAGTARRALKIPGTPKAGTAKSAVRDVALHGSFKGRLDARGEARAKEHVVLRYEGTANPAIEKGQTLAVLASGSDLAWLKVAQEPTVRADAAMVSVPVELVGVSDQGEYKGELLTSVAGTKDKPIAASFTVADGWGLAALVGVLGVLAGLIAKLASGRYLPRLRWRWAQRRIREKYASAAARLADSSLANRFQGPEQGEVNSEVEAIRAKTRSYTQIAPLLFDPSSAEHKAIAAMYAELGDDIRRLGDTTGDDGVVTAVDKLDESIAGFIDWFEEAFPGNAPPSLLRTARAIAGSGPPPERLLPRAGTKLVKDATEAVASLAAWKVFGTRLRRYRVWLFLLAAVANRADAGLIHRIDERLAEVTLELWASLDATEIASADVARELDLVDRSLASLAGRYHIYVPSDWEVQDRGVVEAETSTLMTYAVAPKTADLRLEVQQSEPIAHPRAPAREDASVGQLVGLLAASLTLEVFTVLAGLLAVFVAGRVLYVNEPFGSLADYIAMFTVGLSAQFIPQLFSSLQEWRLPSRALPA